ncbi:tRNA-splicing endonuclease subunit Sen15 isoform X1 [Monomorium pharaonis]|uniref:tRNA-splicing endonuclease subunit Sen15 isoform X1 n=1 Tax=Monomorium pharaonis TaxID=307658 RepID=UPI00063F7E3A|nr:tRNA-splicing endonuclease subunit Sen15 isoform X1 [Monomorium pharaonis]
MYDICHPSYYHLCKLGCNDPIKTSTAFYVYIEICEVKRYWDVKYKYNEELDLIYFEVKKREHSQLEIYIPWPTKYNICLDKIEKMQQLLQNEQLTFVFKSEDSSSVFYTISAGLSKPAPPEVSKQRKEKAEKILNLESEIRRNITNLYELAKTLDSSHETSSQNCNSDLNTTESSNINSNLEIL